MKKILLVTVCYASFLAYAYSQTMINQLPPAAPPGPGDLIATDQPNASSPSKYTTRKQTLPNIGLYGFRNCVGWTYSNWPNTPSCATQLPLTAVQGIGDLIPNSNYQISFRTHADLLNALANSAVAVTTITQQGFNRPGDFGAATYDFNSASLANADGVFVLQSSGTLPSVPGRYIMRIPAGGIYPQAAGAKCDTILGGLVIDDDTTAFNNLIGYLSKNGNSIGTIAQAVQPLDSVTGLPVTCDIHSGDLDIQRGVALQGAGYSIANQILPSYTFTPFIQINPQYSVKVLGAASLQNLTIWREGLMPYPNTVDDILNYQQNIITDNSVGLYVYKASDTLLRDVQVIGFNKCFYIWESGRIHADHLTGDCANLVEVTYVGDWSVYNNIESNDKWAQNFNGRTFVRAATVPPGGGGTGYSVGDILTVGTSWATCYTNPQLRVNSIGGGGIITSYSVSETGDCGKDSSSNPQTFGIGTSPLPTVNAPGANGTNGTNVSLTVNGGSDCQRQPVVLGTISGGQLTAITGVQDPGACWAKGLPAPIANVSGGGLTNTPQIGPGNGYYYVKNPIVLTGGTGSGAQALISLGSSGYRPGIGLYVHDQCDGCQFSNIEFESYQTAVKIQNVAGDRFNTMIAEGNEVYWDQPTIGLDLEHCFMRTFFFGLSFQPFTVGYQMNNAVDNNASCIPAPPSTEAYQDANPIIVGALINTQTQWAQGVVTGPGSYGTWIAPNINLGPSGAKPVVQIGPNSGQWNFYDIAWPVKPGTAVPASEWLSVDSTALSPMTNQTVPLTP